MRKYLCIDLVILCQATASCRRCTIAVELSGNTKLVNPEVTSLTINSAS